VGSARAELAALSAGEDFDTLPDIEIVLEDEEDRDETFASVEPTIELALDRTPFAKKVATQKPVAAKPLAAKPQPPRPVAAPAAPAPKPPAVDDSLDIDLDIDLDLDRDLMGDADRDALEFSKPIAVELEFAKPLASDGDASSADVSAQVAENLSEADFYLEQGLIDEAARIYNSVLELAPQHPKAMLRLGEIEARRGKAPPVEADVAGNAFGDTMVCEPGRSPQTLPPEEPEAFAEAAAIELSVIGEDTIPPLEALDPAPADEIVFAEDSGAPLDLDPEPEHEDSGELDETSESHDEEGEFDLAAMLDEDDAHTSQTIGTLIGVGSVGRGFAEVFSAFKKGIEEQVDEGDADTHYDLAIAYKEMGLNEDAVRELVAVIKTGTRMTEALSLLAHCKLALGDPTSAASHLEDALSRAGDSDSVAVSLRYDLGEALLAAGRDAEAREAFAKVAAADPKFRDVAERIARFG
jgi:tetratricopeptide (TPR) repeat protein